MSTSTVLLLIGGAALLVWAISTGKVSIGSSSAGLTAAQGTTLAQALAGLGPKNEYDLGLGAITAAGGIATALINKRGSGGGSSGSSRSSDGEGFWGTTEAGF